MNCPECGTLLVKVPVLGVDDSMRCAGCGGVWVQSWIINKLTTDANVHLGIAKFEPLQKRTEPMERMICPADGKWMYPSTQMGLPSEVQMWQCDKCKRWWLPDNSIFSLAEAFIVKEEYTKLWSKEKLMRPFTIPIIITVLILMGLGVWVLVVYQRQRAETAVTNSVLGKANVMYLGDNKAEVRFRVNGELESALYKRVGDTDWQQAFVMDQSGMKVFVVEGVKTGEVLWLSLNQNVTKFQVGQKL